MKKTFRKLGMTTALVLAMVGFAACGDDDDDNKGGNNSNGKEQAIDAETTIEGDYYLCADKYGRVFEEGKMESGYEEFQISKYSNSNTKYKIKIKDLLDPESLEWEVYAFSIDFGDIDKILLNYEYTIAEDESEYVEGGELVFFGYRQTIKITGNETFETRVYEWSKKDKSDIEMESLSYYKKTSTSR